MIIKKIIWTKKIVFQKNYISKTFTATAIKLKKTVNIEQNFILKNSNFCYRTSRKNTKFYLFRETKYPDSKPQKKKKPKKSDRKN